MKFDKLGLRMRICRFIFKSIRTFSLFVALTMTIISKFSFAAPVCPITRQAILGTELSHAENTITLLQKQYNDDLSKELVQRTLEEINQKQPGVLTTEKLEEAVKLTQARIFDAAYSAFDEDVVKIEKYIDSKFSSPLDSNIKIAKALAKGVQGLSKHGATSNAPRPLAIFLVGQMRATEEFFTKSKARVNELMARIRRTCPVELVSFRMRIKNRDLEFSKCNETVALDIEDPLWGGPIPENQCRRLISCDSVKTASGVSADSTIWVMNCKKKSDGACLTMVECAMELGREDNEVVEPRPKSNKNDGLNNI